MGGMRLTPKDVHRQVIRRDDREHGGEPSVYAVWLGEPEKEDSVLLGRTERMSRPRWWRCFPVSGRYPKEIRGHVTAIEWLIGQRETISGA